MKILWISHIFIDTDTFKTNQIETINNLKKLGNQVTFLVPKNKINKEKDIIYLPTIKKPFFSSLIFNIILFFFLPFFIISKKIDIIITDHMSLYGALPVILIKKLLDKRFKFLLIICSVPVEVKGIYGQLQKAQYALSIFISKKICKGITFLTDYMAKEECKKFKINYNKIYIWLTGVNEELFNPELYKQESKKLRQRSGLEKKFIIFYHGSMSSNRGLQNAVRAINLLKKDYPDIVLFFLGEGEAKNELKEMIKENGLERNVILHDVVDYKEVPRYILMMDAGIIPLPKNMWWDYQPALKLLEYLSMEKVTILTDLIANTSILNKKKGGIFIKSHEPEEIKRGILLAYKNKKKLREFGKSGRVIILKKYTWKKIAKDFERFLKN